MKLYTKALVFYTASLLTLYAAEGQDLIGHRFGFSWIQNNDGEAWSVTPSPKWISVPTEDFLSTFSVVCETFDVSIWLSEDLKRYGTKLEDIIESPKGSNHYYILFPAKVAFTKAKAMCRGLGMTMAQVRDSKENEIVHELCNQPKVHGCWLGLKEVENSESWSWTSNMAVLTNASYSNWFTGHPKNINYKQWQKGTGDYVPISDNDAAVIGFRSGRYRPKDGKGMLIYPFLFMAMTAIGFLLMHHNIASVCSSRNICFCCRLKIMQLGNEGMNANSRTQNFYSQLGLLAALMMSVCGGWLTGEVENENPIDADFHGMITCVAIFLYLFVALQSVWVLIGLSKCDEGPQTVRFMENMGIGIKVPVIIFMGAVIATIGSLGNFYLIKFTVFSEIHFYNCIGGCFGCLIIVVHFFLLTTDSVRHAHFLRAQKNGCHFSPQAVDAEAAEKHSVSLKDIEMYFQEYLSKHKYLSNNKDGVLSMDSIKWLAFLEDKFDQDHGDGFYVTTVLKEVAGKLFSNYVQVRVSEMCDIYEGPFKPYLVDGDWAMVENPIIKSKKKESDVTKGGLNL
jgi:hypothetical protein